MSLTFTIFTISNGNVFRRLEAYDAYIYSLVCYKLREKRRFLKKVLKQGFFILKDENVIKTNSIVQKYRIIKTNKSAVSMIIKVGNRNYTKKYGNNKY